MRYLILSVLMFFLCSTVVNAQSSLERNLEKVVMKKVEEYKREQAAKKHQEQQKEQLGRQIKIDSQKNLNSLNQTKAENYLNPPQHQKSMQNATEQPGHNFNSKGINNNGETRQIPSVVATPKMAKTNHSKGTAFGNSGNIGTPTYSGNNYTGDRYNLKPAGFSNIQQPRKTSEQIRGQYKPSRTMNQGVINTQQTHTPSRASMQRSPQQDNTQNVESVQAQKTRGTHKTQQASNQQRIAQKTRGTQKMQQASNQQRTEQNIASTQMPQKKEVPIREHVGANRIVNINPSQGPHPNTGRDNSSPDFRPAEIPNPNGGMGTKAKYTAYKIQNEAYNLSDRDNKTPSKYTGLGRTEMQQYQMGSKDMMNGFASFDNPRKWDYIYNVEFAGTVRIPSRTAKSIRK